MPLPAPNRPRISEALGTNVTALGSETRHPDSPAPAKNNEPLTTQSARSI
jgi:hypothetical protein